MARRTHDPAERREAALKFLAERYYQASREFSHILTASFPPDSATAEKLLASRECLLDFEQFSQRYRLHCTVRRLSPNTPLHRAAPSLFPIVASIEGSAITPIKPGAGSGKVRHSPASAEAGSAEAGIQRLLIEMDPRFFPAFSPLSRG